MKLRFRQNSMRLRVNRREVEQLAVGEPLTEMVAFPGSRLTYVLESTDAGAAQATLTDNTICISAPEPAVKRWADGSEIGIYYELATADGPLKIAIEKDLECLDGPEEERDPLAFERDPNHTC